MKRLLAMHKLIINNQIIKVKPNSQSQKFIARGLDKRYKKKF